MSDNTPASSPEPPHAAPNTPFVVLIAGAAALGGFLFGFDTAVINGAVRALEHEFAATSWQIGLAVSVALVGSAIGAFFAGALADALGRVRCMLVAASLFTISALGSGLPFGMVDFILWRFIGGVGVGAASVIAPAYIAEVAPAEMRGRLGSLQQLAIVVGIFVALLNNFAIVSVAGSAEAPHWLGRDAWAWMFWAEIPMAVLYGVCALLIPESPRFLVARGRDAEATAVLRRILGEEAEAKVAEIRQTVETERKPRLSDLRGGDFGLLPIVWIGMGLSVLQQFVGINVIFYYGSALWQVVGFSESDALILTVITGVTNIVTTLIAIACVDRFGRKPLLLIGSIGMALTLATMAWVFGTAPLDAEGFPQLTGSAGPIALVAANVYVFCFGFSWGPVVWVLLGEMFNNRIRAAALATSAAVQWIANFLVSTSFPPMVFNLGVGTAYGTYAVFAMLSFGFVLVFVRETKGMELEEME
ncbi:MAG: sugar porter family MFS transporter [Myxococcota bacterium]|nr:sugar porter family MFS transporter [Myxococcota bacterium]